MLPPQRKEVLSSYNIGSHSLNKKKSRESCVENANVEK